MLNEQTTAGPKRSS